jgi:hypothetical protein
LERTQSLDTPDGAPLDATTAQASSLRGRVALVTGAARIGVSGARTQDAELTLGALARAGFDFDFGGGRIDREEGEDG